MSERKSVTREDIVDALNDAYRYKDRDNAEPELPFIDDVEVFWEPFGALVFDALPATPPASEPPKPAAHNKSWTTATFPYPPASETDLRYRFGGSAYQPASETVGAALTAVYHRAYCPRDAVKGHAMPPCGERADAMLAAIRAESDERVRALREAAEAVVPAWDIAVLAAYEGGYGAVPAEFGALADTIVALRAALDAAPEDAHKT